MTAHAQKQGLAPIVVGAIGVVFGDIGTSPLYTLKEAFGPHYGLVPDEANVIGVLSLVFWAMFLIVTIKYVTIILRADNRGEGGILALMTVVQRNMPVAAPLGYTVGILGILGCALFFGDAVITPAISVLSAIEGLEVAAPSLHRFIVPAAVVVLLALFSFQRHGTERVGKIFGPVMIVWFVCIAGLGAWQMLQNPGVLRALNPWWAWNFFAMHAFAAWFSLGAIVLCVTGGEALYADMGHFGRVPIRLAWTTFVMPALLLNYFGQGALLLAHPEAVQNPFYRLVPTWALFPMIALATLATVIASQAVISGAFSLARQAIQLGYLPRLKLIHTSDETIGQVYLPWVNRLLLVCVLVLVIAFGSSSALAAAYGVSVTGSMLIDTILLLILADGGRWMPAKSVNALGIHLGQYRVPLRVIGIAFLAMDLALFSANATKFFHGAWVPVALGIVVFTLMRTWRRGRALVRAQIDEGSLGIEHFVQSIMTSPPARVPGTAVFLTPSSQLAPPSLLHNLKHNKVLHARNIILSVETLQVPHADAGERVIHTDLGHGFARLRLRFGYMDDPDVPKALATWDIPGPPMPPMETSYFASRETIIAKRGHGMAQWRDQLFLFMSRNARPATEYFSVPGNRLVELGSQVVI